MKKVLILILAIFLFFQAPPTQAIESLLVKDLALYNELKGFIILRVENKGEAYYVSPKSPTILYLGRPSDAFNVMRESGIGVTNKDLAKIPTSGKHATASQDAFIAKQKGKILLAVQGRGEAWYVNPKTGTRTFLGKPKDAFTVMQKLGMGISNKDFERLAGERLSISKIKEEMAQTPAPLIVTIPVSVSGTLTRNGVTEATNKERFANGGLPPLQENAVLNQVAEAKALDMFKEQYFGHVSPKGLGPQDLVREANYAYILVGENLALGNFASDRAIVEAWMNSPGHRANILRKGYSEIGVAVIQGTYQGRETWIGVQTFALPSSVCPSVDQSLKATIETLNSQIDAKNQLGAQMRAELESLNPKTPDEINAYNQKAADYNELVKEISQLVNQNKVVANDYNKQVANYNACISEKTAD